LFLAFKRRAARRTEPIGVLHETVEAAPEPWWHVGAHPVVVGLTGFEGGREFEAENSQSLEAGLAQLIGVGIEANDNASPSGGHTTAKSPIIHAAGFPRCVRTGP
jgi:hypothetical protein